MTPIGLFQIPSRALNGAHYLYDLANDSLFGVNDDGEVATVAMLGSIAPLTWELVPEAAGTVRHVAPALIDVTVNIASQASDGEITVKDLMEATGAVGGGIIGGIVGTAAGAGTPVSLISGPAGSIAGGALGESYMGKLHDYLVNGQNGTVTFGVQSPGSGGQGPGRVPGGKPLAGDEYSILDEIAASPNGVNQNRQADHYSPTNPSGDNNPQNDNDWRLASDDWRHSGSSLVVSNDLEGPELSQRAAQERRRGRESEAIDQDEDIGSEGLRDDQGRTKDDPNFSGPQLVALDLDGNGISITELNQPQKYVDGGDGLLHRTAWAAPHDGVLFFDVDGGGDLAARVAHTIATGCSARS